MTTLSDFESSVEVRGNEVFNVFGTFIGTIIKDTYYTSRRPEHFMRIFQGFGVSLNVLKYLKNHNIKFIIIKYVGKTGDITYSTSVQRFIDSIKDFTFTQGEIEDKQKFLSTNEMIII
jgi:hypothetical protein